MKKSLSNYSKYASKTKEQIRKYLKDKSHGLPLHIAQSIEETGYGIFHSGSALFSEIARALKEPVRLKKTIERLTRNLRDENISDTLDSNHISDIKHIITNETIIAVDDTDISKPRSSAQECLDQIHDGSSGCIEKGYTILKACVVSRKRDRIVPILSRLYSSKEKDYISRNYQRELVYSRLFESFDCRGVYVGDRAFSETSNLRRFGNRARFVFRSMDRTINHNRKEYQLDEWASNRKLRYGLVIEKIKNGKRKTYDASFGVYPIEVGGQKLIAVVMRLADHEPCVLLTNQSKQGFTDYQFGRKVIRQYGCRWSIEEYIRFEKQQFNIENIRVRKLSALKNYITLINVVAAFTDHMLHNADKLKDLSLKIQRFARPLREHVRIQYYRLVEGIKALLRRRHPKPFEYTHRAKSPQKFEQLCFQI